MSVDGNTDVGVRDMIKQKRSNVETNRYTAANINYTIDNFYLYFFYFSSI